MIFKAFRKTLRVLSRFTVLLVVLFIAAVAAFVWSFTNYQNTKSQLTSLQNGQPIPEKQLNKITNDVARHMILPEGAPTVVVVKDAAALADQAFFKNAQNGDIVLIYPEQAIIYSPERGVIVNVGPVVNQNGDVAGEQNAATAQQTQTGDVSVEVRNGSTVAGRASTVGDEIDSLAGYAVTTTTNAKNKAYAETVIVNLKGRDVAALETKFGVKAVTAMPAGEAASLADVVVILGN